MRTMKGIAVVVCAMALLGSCAGAQHDGADVTMTPSQTRGYLEQLHSGEMATDDVVITYTDLHGMHGGYRLSMSGSGRVTQEAVRVEVKEAHDLSREDLRELATVLLEHEVWKQRVRERTPLPDEGRAYLKIEADGKSREIWEWYNDLEENGRLIRVREEMKRLAWSEPPSQPEPPN